MCFHSPILMHLQLNNLTLTTTAWTMHIPLWWPANMFYPDFDYQLYSAVGILCLRSNNKSSAWKCLLISSKEWLEMTWWVGRHTCEAIYRLHMASQTLWPLIWDNALYKAFLWHVSYHYGAIRIALNTVVVDLNLFHADVFMTFSFSSLWPVDVMVLYQLWFIVAWPYQALA